MKAQKKAQKLINAVEYPPTHTYKLATLTPTKSLKDRCQKLQAFAPHFFHTGNKFLDIGCSKGYFVLYMARHCKVSVGVDSNDNPDLLKLWDILLDNSWPTQMGGLVGFNHASFGKFESHHKFDRIFMGNVHHYIYREYGDWRWTHKLASLAANDVEVLVEGPEGMHCKDMLDCMPQDLRPGFKEKHFLDHMQEAGFEMIQKGQTISYTPDRSLWLFTM
jgi:hypothetical protein